MKSRYFERAQVRSVTASEKKKKNKKKKKKKKPFLTASLRGFKRLLTFHKKNKLSDLILL